MVISGLLAGERPGGLQWSGFLLAIGGLVYLVSPGLTAPEPVGSGLMAAAGIGWGVYSVRGRGAADPVGTTTDNFIRSVPFVLVTSLLFLDGLEITTRGAVIAAVSGSVTSGLGYVVWYAALRGLTTTRAAVVQLAVPVIASVGGIVLLSEEPTVRLGIATVLILGGIGLAVQRNNKRS